MSYLFSLYQLGFLVFLGALGLLMFEIGPAPAMAASPVRLQLPDLSPPPTVRKPGRRFKFMTGARVELAPARLKGTDRYDYYAALATHSGHEPWRTTVLGLRGLAPDGGRHPSGDNMTDYDDTFVILQPVTRQSRELLGSTHAGQAVSSMSPNGVAQIQPGFYEAQPCGDFNGMAAWWLTSSWEDGRIPCWRDKDGDGFIGSKERADPSIATEILFHNGRNDDYGTSIGCQVLSPRRMEAFIETVGESQSFDYVLIDANQPVR